MNTNVLKDFNAFYLAYWADPEATKLALISDAAKLILELVKKGEYSAYELLEPDYMQLFDMLGWPCFGADGGGLFENSLKAALELAFKVMGYDPIKMRKAAKSH